MTKYTLKGSEILDMAVSINTALGSLKDVSVQLGLKLAYNSRQLRDICKVLDERRQALLDQHTKIGEDGEPMKVKDEATGVVNHTLADPEAFRKDVDTLHAEEFDVELKPIALDILPAKIDPILIAGMYTIIVEDAPAAEKKIERPVPIKPPRSNKDKH